MEIEQVDQLLPTSGDQISKCSRYSSLLDRGRAMEMERVDQILPISGDQNSKENAGNKSGKMESYVRTVGDSQPKGGDIIYTVNDIPPWYSCILFALQHYLLFIGGAILVPLAATSYMCMADDDLGKSEVINTNIFVSGIATILQCMFGTRLPIFQGHSLSFLSPLIAILALPEWECPETPAVFANSSGSETYMNMTYMNMTYREWRRSVWIPRMNEIQGAITMAALFQVGIGLTGVIGFCLRFIGPLTVAPTLCLIGLSVQTIAGNLSSGQWGIAILTVFLLTLFSQYLAGLRVPLPMVSKKGCKSIRVSLFKMFPVIFAVVIVWVFCAILTQSGVLPRDSEAPNYKARTDTKLHVLSEAKWFKVPYPGQWGVPTISAAGVLGMMAGVMASVIESVGDYYACARISKVPSPPPHAINRGILFEGVGVMLAGLCGSSSGVTSHSDNIGAIGITKVASRRVIVISGVMMVVFGMVGKLGAFFVTIPEPLAGGIILALFGMISAVGVSNLQFVDLTSSRNLYVFGLALLFGVTVPGWMVGHSDELQTGVTTLDQVIRVLLSTPMFVGGVMALILDNTIPGTREERGLVKWLEESRSETDQAMRAEIYDFPVGMTCVRKMTCFKYLPFCPTFGSGGLKKEKDERYKEEINFKVVNVDGKEEEAQDNNQCLRTHV